MSPTLNVVAAPPFGAQVDIVLPQDRPYSERIARFVDSTGVPLNIALWDFAVDIRREHDGVPVLVCTLSNGRITRNTALGHIVLNLSLADVQGLGVGRFRYDIRVLRTHHTNTWYPGSGYLRITPQITR
jgi:hypothetical protein